MPLHRDAPRDSLGETYEAMRIVTGAVYDGTEADDYADLDDADLPPHASVHLADMTGRPVEHFEGNWREVPHPDLDELEEASER